MASHPPSYCCAVGFKETGTPVGQYQTIGGIDSYVVKPSKETGRGVLILTDIFGYKFLNSQLVADSFAQNGYTAVIPDLFYGDTVELNPPADFDFMAWLTKGTNGKGSHLPENIDPIVEATIKGMRSELGITRLAAAGYCFGAKYVVRFLKPGQFDVGYGAHPSFVEPDELKAMKGPLSIAAAETDQIFPADKRHETEEILAAHPDRLPYQICLYSHTEHGFAVRGDTSKKEVAAAKKAAFVQAAQWFEQYL